MLSDLRFLPGGLYDLLVPCVLGAASGMCLGESVLVFVPGSLPAWRSWPLFWGMSCARAGSCWHLLRASAQPPQPHSPTPQMLFLGLLLLCQGAAFLAFSLLFSFSFTFIPSSSSCSPATGCCLSLLRHQFLVLLGAESQALPRKPLHRGGHRRNISCPRSLARASGSGSRELACRPGEFAADSRHYAC